MGGDLGAPTVCTTHSGRHPLKTTRSSPGFPPFDSKLLIIRRTRHKNKHTACTWAVKQPCRSFAKAVDLEMMRVVSSLAAVRLTSISLSSSSQSTTYTLCVLIVPQLTPFFPSPPGDAAAGGMWSAFPTCTFSVFSVRDATEAERVCYS